MDHIMQSAELQLVESCPNKAETALSGCIAGSATALCNLTARQRSGACCSTSSSAGVSQPVTAERRKPRPSSVRSRAAFFEALSSPPPSLSPLSDMPCNAFDGSHPSPKQACVSRSKPSQSHEPESQPSQVGGQEVEMVDQGMQEQNSFRRLPGQPGQPCLPLSSDKAHAQQRSSSEVCNSLMDKTQAQAAVLGPDAPSFAVQHPTVSRSSDQQVGAGPMDGAMHLLDAVGVPADEEGIEMQEQGHVEMLEHALERLQSELAERNKQGATATSALACKTQECESLMRIVRELTENRSKLVCAKTNLAEKLAEMQHEYMRLMRVADLSRVVSKENVAKTIKVMKTLKQVQDESARQQHLIGYFKERNKNLKDENMELKERVCLLERLDLLSYSRDSVCMREFKLHALKETY